MPLILGTNSIKDTDLVTNSLRFDDGSSDYLSRTPASAGNRKTWTWSGWVKKSKIESFQTIFSAGTNANSINIDGGNGTENSAIGIDGFYNGTRHLRYTSSAYRDVSAWLHIVVAVDTTQATDSNRIKLWVNGSQVGLDESIAGSWPTQNSDGVINNNVVHSIGRRENVPDGYYDGYLAEVCFIDGQALDPTSFGEFDEDSGIWKPIDVSGLTFGTNGFYLDFENSGSLGNDKSGNGNNFTVNNLTSIDQTTDTCTNNFCTMNPLVPTTSLNFSDGNLTLTGTNSTNYSSNNTSTFGVSSGKWYVEVEYDTTGNVATSLGISPISISPTTNPTGSISDVVIVTMENQLYVEGINSASYLGSTPTTGDIIQIALDMDNGKVFFGLNGTFVGDPVAGTGGAFSGITSGETIAINVRALNSVFKFNFGNPPFSISSGNSDANGYGNFEYAVPSGYYSLNTKNLAEYG